MSEKYSLFLFWRRSDKYNANGRKTAQWARTSSFIGQ